MEFQRCFPKQFIMVRYNELNDNPIPITKEIFGFCGLGINQQTIEFINKSCEIHNSDPYSVYRAKATDEAWTKILPNEIVQSIQTELNNTIFEKFIK